MFKRDEKIQVMLLKNQMKKEQMKKHHQVIVTKLDDFLYICIAGHRLHRIHKNNWFLNLETLTPPSQIGTIFTDAEKVCDTEAYFTGYTRSVDSGTVIEIKTREGYSVWLNEKYVKEYGDPRELVFLVDTDKRNSVAIPMNYAGYKLGLICPVNA